MKKQTGFTLIEIMIALLLGLIVVGSTIAIYIVSIRSSTDVIRSARLNHDMDSAMALMINDIRRAGYWGGAIAGADSRDNPFTQNDTNLQIVSADCLLYTYDANGNGANTLQNTADDVDNNEYYGFRLTNGDIQMRLSCDPSAGACNDNDDDDTWETMNITEGGEQVDITNLAFTESFKCLRKRLDEADQTFDSTCAAAITAGNIITDDRVLETREIAITMSGRVNRDQAVTKTINGQVKIRNDRIFTQ